MRLENIKYDFPKMPEEMKNMIEREVEKQIRTEQPKIVKNRWTAGKTIAASLAAVMLCGTTVFAGVGIYRMQQEKVGEHGVNVSIAGEENQDARMDTQEQIETTKVVSIPDVKLEVGYIPEGMVKTEQGKYSYENALHKGGVSMVFYRMDTGDDKFKMQHGDVLSSEEFSVGGHDGVYLEYPSLCEDEITFNQKIYLAFTDVHYVMEMFVASYVTKEEALKITENVKLVPIEDAQEEEIVVAQDWSAYQESLDNSFEESEESYQMKLSASKEEMKNTHAIGDSFALNDEGLAVKVSDVKVADDFSLLDPSLVDEDMRKELDKNGKLRSATIRYIKDGDLDSLSQEVKSREVSQKLIYATVEYTNTGEGEMSDVLFFSDMARITEVDGQMQIQTEEQPGEGDEWEHAINNGLSSSWEMCYYDVHGGERGNNYIPSIKPGETVTVHMAWIATEEELGSLYLSFDTSGGSEFTDSSLKIGYVDIRQQ